jgi:hypothetical protein
MKKQARAFLAIILSVTTLAFVANSTAHANMGDRKVFFKNLKEGQKIPQGYKIEFGVMGMKVVPAGTMGKDGKMSTTTGHFHLIIDSAFTPEGQVVATDATHLHFGKGQMEAAPVLTPGPHTLTLQFADSAHMSYGESMSKTVHVTVTDEKK